MLMLRYSHKLKSWVVIRGQELVAQFVLLKDAVMFYRSELRKAGLQ